MHENPDHHHLLDTFKKKPNWPRRIFLSVLFVLVIGTVFFSYAVRANEPPSTFPTPDYFRVASGATVHSVSEDLVQDGLIRSRVLFEFFIVLENGQAQVQEGDYAFQAPATTATIALRIARGRHDLEQFKVTIPEGSTAKQIAALFVAKLPNLNEQTLYQTLLPDEGYLFPETYFFSPLATPAEIRDGMRAMFDEKTASLKTAFAMSKLSMNDVITLASIIEKEADTNAERPIIAGILLKRLDKGMPLQVDAPFAYILGKDSAQLTVSDLQTNSPYNTYTNIGLPPTPISNPGLPSIEAVLFPTLTPYFFYLHDAHGMIHYATTYAEQLANEETYLQQ